MPTGQPGPRRCNSNFILETIDNAWDDEISTYSEDDGESLNLSCLDNDDLDGDDSDTSDSEHNTSRSLHQIDFEDDKAVLLSKLMSNHSQVVSASLVERSCLIQSVNWLSQHVPGCVLRHLFDNILLARKKKRRCERRRQHSINDFSDYMKGSATDNPGSVLDYNDAVNMCYGAKNPGANVTSNLNVTEENIQLNSAEVELDASSLSLKSSIKSSGMIHDILPIANFHNSALLFVDISGFTKISTILDIESLSNAINSYFQLIVNEVTSYNGDILKFAGDAIFAEWKIGHQKQQQNLQYCVLRAADCAASIVANCSDYPIFAKPIGKSRSTLKSEYISQTSAMSLKRSCHSADEHSYEFSQDDWNLRSSLNSAVTPVKIATLNVKCGVGVGQLVGVHVGDSISRREYLILGDPIDQVATAESIATTGEVFASPEALEVMSKICTISGKYESALSEKRPMCIASRHKRFYQKHQSASRRSSEMLHNMESLRIQYDDLDYSELLSLKSMISLYVHPVVVNDENESDSHLKQESDHERHLAEAELRNVYVMFISPLIEHRLSGDATIDIRLMNLLNDIMNVTTRELSKVKGHLRQFIVDDKGVVLICTFGLRGSTFPSMISQRALPFTLSIRNALQEQLGIKSTVGATFGKAYCGVVGGLTRHEFAVLGPSVNLAARLMASKFNPGILVDKNVRLLTSQIYFKSLPAVKAKGYDDPVPIFEPIKPTDSQWGRVKDNFIGRSAEIKHIMRIAKDMSFEANQPKLLLVTAASGTGKSSMIVQSTEYIRAMLKRMKKHVIVTRNISNEGDSRVPFSLFRSVFKDILSEVKQIDDISESNSLRRDSHQKKRFSNSTEFSVEEQWEHLSLKSHSSKDSVMSTDAHRFRFICEELNAPPDFIDVVGRRLLGLRDKTIVTSNSYSGTPDLVKIVDFLADAFIRCTKHASLVLLALDDVHNMDEMSWKVVQAIFERGENVLILCGSRPPSTNPLAVDLKFWTDLHECYHESKRFFEIDLKPLNESEVLEFIASTLKLNVNEIDSSFSRNIFTTSGGMPHYLSYALENIKRNDLSLRLENGLIGLKSISKEEDKMGFGSVSELLLYRLDALDSSVRNTLQFTAVLGTEFELVDAALVYDEMYLTEDNDKSKASLVLLESLNSAVEEGIIEESLILGNNDEEDVDIIEEKTSLGRSMGNMVISLKGVRKTHPAYAENRRYRFTHDSWKSSILTIMLAARVQEIHEHVAIVFERELDSEDSDRDDFEKQIRVLKHWNASGHFTKASEHALKIGAQLMSLGLNSQCILLFDDVLDTLKLDSNESEEKYGDVSATVINAIEERELENLIKLNVAKGKALCTLDRAKEGADSMLSALDILQNAPSANSSLFDRSVSFPIFSGLFVVLKMGMIQQDEACTYEKDLCKRFVEQARLNNDPVHYGRALAMEGETLGRLGNFEQALETLETIKTIYNIETQHTAICKAYGTDRVSQSFSHSVNWNRALGRTEAALLACRYIIEELAPKSDPRNIHGSFCLLYSSIIFMKDNGMAFEARDIFLSRIVEPFHEYFGSNGTTFSKPLFYPILMLLDLQGNEDSQIDSMNEYLDWASKESNFSICSASLENAWAGIAVSPNTLLGEICYYLAKRPERGNECGRLIQMGIDLVEKSVTATKGLTFAHLYAKEKQKMLKKLACEHNIIS